MATPNYISGSARLVTTRWDFQKHVEGLEFRHNAYNIDVGPTVTYPTAPTLYIQGIPYYTVADALYALANDLANLDGYSINSFVYRAGSGMTGPVIFDTFDAAVNAANFLNGAATTIIVDDTGGVATASGSYNLTGITLVGAKSGVAISALTFQSGSTITGVWLNLQRLKLVSVSSTPILILPTNTIINIGDFANIAGSSLSPFVVINSSQLAFNIIGGVLGDGINVAATIISSVSAIANVSVDGAIENNAVSGAGTFEVFADWGTTIGTQIATTTVIRPTITQLQAITVPTPSVNNTVLTYNSGVFSWNAAGGGGGGSGASFIYRQGSGATGPVVYGTFAGAVAAANTLNGGSGAGAEATIFIDNSGGLPVSGIGPYNLQNITLIGLSTFASLQPTVSMTFSGGSISNIWTNIENLLLLTTASSPPVYVVQTNDIIRMGFNSSIQSQNPPSSNFFSLSAGTATLILEDLAILGDNTHEVFDIASGAVMTVFANYDCFIQTNAFGGLGIANVQAAWGASIGSQTVTTFNVIYPTITAIQNIPISATAPTSGKVLGYNGTEWIPTTPSSGSSVTGSGFWHSTGGTLDGMASVGASGGEFALTNAGHTDIVWANLSSDVTNSSSTPGKLAVVKIQGNTVTAGALVEGDLLIATSTSNWASTAVTGDISFSAVTPGLATNTGLRGITVPAPSGTNTVLTYNSGAYTWNTGSSGGGGSSFIYQAGSSTGPVVYGTFAGAVMAANSQGGPCTITIVGNGTTTATAYNLANITLQGASGTLPSLTFINGSSISNIWENISNLAISSSASSSIFTVPANTTVLIGPSSQVKSTTSSAFFSVPNSGCIFNVSQLAVLGDGTHPAITIASSITAVVIVGLNGQISTDAIAGAGTCVVEADLGASISGTQTVTAFDVVYPFLGASIPVGSGSNTILTYNAGAYSWAAGGGGSVTWADDLAGSANTNQYINSISGHAGAGGTVQLNINEFQFSSFSTPVITQQVLGGTGTTAGKLFTIQSQAGQVTSTSTNNNGATLLLVSGAPGTGGSGGIPGGVSISLGGTISALELSSTSTSSSGGIMTIGVPLVEFGSTVANPIISQAAISGTGSTAGQYLEILAQSGQAAPGSGGTGGAGGTVIIEAGAGGASFGTSVNSVGGHVYLITGAASTGGSGGGGETGYVSILPGSISGTGGWFMGQFIGSPTVSAIYTNAAAPSTTNCVLSSDGLAETILNAPGANPELVFSIGGSVIPLILGLSGLVLGTTFITLTSSNVTLTPSQYINPRINISGTPSVPLTITFPDGTAPGTNPGVWIVDVSQLTLGGNTLSLRTTGGASIPSINSTTIGLPTGKVTLFTVATTSSPSIACSVTNN